MHPCRQDRERYGLIDQAARALGVAPAVYRAREAAERWPAWETYDRIERLFGWPRSFRWAGSDTQSLAPSRRCPTDESEH